MKRRRRLIIPRGLSWNSAAATNTLQLRGGSGLFRNKWILIARRRADAGCDGPRHFWRKCRIVAGEARAGAFDRTAVRLRGRRRDRGCAQCRRQQERCGPSACNPSACTPSARDANARSSRRHAEHSVFTWFCSPKSDAGRSRPAEHPIRTSASCAPRRRPSRKQREHRPDLSSNPRKPRERRRHL